MRNLLGLAIIAAFFPVAASAAHMYVGGGYGNTEVEFSEEYKDAIDAAGVSSDESDNGVKLFLGYRLSENLAVETFYADLGEASISNQETSLSMEAATLGISFLAFYPVAANVDLFGRLGVHAWNVDATSSTGLSASNDGTDLAYGVGAAYKMGQVSFRAEYEQFNLDNDDIDMVSVAFVYSY